MTCALASLYLPKIKLILGLKSYGTHPLHGEYIQQYRWSKKGYADGRRYQPIILTPKNYYH